MLDNVLICVDTFRQKVSMYFLSIVKSGLGRICPLPGGASLAILHRFPPSFVTSDVKVEVKILKLQQDRPPL